MFHFPAFPPAHLYIQRRVTRHHSCRVSPFGHPRINARLTAPRGISQPPTSFIGSLCQGIHHAPLNTYNTKNQNMRQNYTTTNNTSHQQATPHGQHMCARCSQPLSTNQTPHPTTKMERQPAYPRFPTRDEEPRACCLKSPIVCLAILTSPITRIPYRLNVCCAPEPHPLQATAHLTNRSGTEPHTMWAGLGLVVLLRKEVIQPHLPVRLPCYDFVPIADPTFDGSLPQGVRPPASGVTDFHDVTGGVYKARERIHRSVADLRLLATPTSRGRVADPDPN